MDRITYLVNQYLENACTREEMEELLDYIEQNPQDDRILAALERAWENEEDPGHGNNRYRRRIVPLKRESAGRFLPRNVVWKVAASVLLVAACLWGLWPWPEKASPQFAGDQSLKDRSVATRPAEPRLIVLPDRSRVWINGDSRLTYGPSFDKNTREVVLEGEAFFDIAHDARRPFIIRTGKVTTTVLGTSFSIRAFPGENVVTVTVTRGKVRVESGDAKGKTLTENQQLSVDVVSSEVKRRVVDAVEATRWIKSDLILHEVTLGEIEGLLEEQYAVDLRFETVGLKGCRFTATFYRDATLEEVMTAICLVNGASYKITGDTVTIYGEGCDGSAGGE